jgi:phosphomannomutase
MSTSAIAEYRCPGQSYAISPSVHLGRLARFYPACRQCAYREDTGSLSARQVRHLGEVWFREPGGSLFHKEGAGGDWLNRLDPATARQIAAAFGIYFAHNSLARDAQDAASPPRPTIILAGDGRPLIADVLAAAGEGLRWAGCQVVDIGPATSACMAWAIERLQAAGGLLVGEALPDTGGLPFNHIVRRIVRHNPTYVGLKFFAPGSCPVSRGAMLERIEELSGRQLDRPSRTSAPSHRYQAETPYLAELQPCYHALRPLRVALDCDSAPLITHLRQLTQSVACRIFPCRISPERAGQSLIEENAHFAARVEDDGEVCQVFDERGRFVPHDRLLLLLAKSLVGWVEGRDPPYTIVMEETASPALARQLESLGFHVVTSAPGRAVLYGAMRESGALLGGGPSGRFWYCGARASYPQESAGMSRESDAAGTAALPLPDALRTLTLLLVLLSRSDRPFSVVLDEESPIE